MCASSQPFATIKPAHFERIEEVVDVEEHACPCCGGALHRIGSDSLAARCRPATFRGAGHALSALWLPFIRKRGGPGSDHAGIVERGIPTETLIDGVRFAALMAEFGTGVRLRARPPRWRDRPAHQPGDGGTARKYVFRQDVVTVSKSPIGISRPPDFAQL